MLKRTALLDIRERVNYWISEGIKNGFNLLSITGYDDYSEKPYSDYKDVDLYGIIMDGDFEAFLDKQGINFEYISNNNETNIIKLEKDNIEYIANTLTVPTEAFVLGEDEEDYYEEILDLSSFRVKHLCEASTCFNKEDIMKLWIQEGLSLDYSLEDTEGEYIVTPKGETISMFGVYFDGDLEEFLNEKGISYTFSDDNKSLYISENNNKYSLEVYDIKNRFDEDLSDELLVQLSSIKSA